MAADCQEAKREVLFPTVAQLLCFLVWRSEHSADLPVALKPNPKKSSLTKMKPFPWTGFTFSFAYQTKMTL